MKNLLFSLTTAACAMLLALTPALAQTTLVPNDTGHGTQFGTQPYQGLSFFGAQPVVQQPATQDAITTLQTLGLVASGTAPRSSSANGGSIAAGSFILQTGTGAAAAANAVLTTGTASPVGTAAKFGTVMVVATSSSTAAIYYKASGTGTSGWLTLTGT